MKHEAHLKNEEETIRFGMDLYGMLVDGENKKKVQELLYIQHFRECMSDLLKSIKISSVMIF